VEGEKMAKSKGNFFTVRELIEEGHDPLVLRYMLMSVHYRKQLNFSDESLMQAKGALGRLKDFLYRLHSDSFSEGRSNEVEGILSKARKTFEESLDDDLNISGALGALFEMIYQLNKIGDKGQIGAQDVPAIEALVRKMDQVLAVASFPETTISDEIETLIQKRNEARRKKDFKAADEIRDRLLAQGIVLEDTPGGTRWKKS